jgi:hypothetical protein
VGLLRLVDALEGLKRATQLIVRAGPIEADRLVGRFQGQPFVKLDGVVVGSLSLFKPAQFLVDIPDPLVGLGRLPA